MHTLTIGIPAYNEAQNIGSLLRSLLLQKQTNYVLKSLIISSDNSTDSTKKVVQSFKDKRIHFLDNAKRQGQAVRQNQIIAMCESDVLVLLNADILISDSLFLAKLIEPVISKTADLTSSALEATGAKSFLARAFSASLIARNQVYDSYKNGLNLYTCHGAARAFSRKFYRDFRFQGSIAEDAYSYLASKIKGYRYAFVPGALAYIRWPETFGEHYSQSIRFFQSKLALKKIFSVELLDREYRLPTSLVVKALLYFFAKHPLYALTYFVIYLYMAAIFRFKRFALVSDTWVMAKSSKKLI